MYEKPTADIILSGGKLKAFLLRLGVRQGCPLLPRLSNTVLEISARAIRKEKEVKCIWIVKKEVKLSLFTDGTILYLENLKFLERKKKLLELINEFIKNEGYKIKIKNQLHFYSN